MGAARQILAPFRRMSTSLIADIAAHFRRHKIYYFELIVQLQCTPLSASLIICLTHALESDTYIGTHSRLAGRYFRATSRSSGRKILCQTKQDACQLRRLFIGLHSQIETPRCTCAHTDSVRQLKARPGGASSFDYRWLCCVESLMSILDQNY